MAINSQDPGSRDGSGRDSGRPGIDDLAAAGDYDAAGARAEELGAFERAADLYERVWRFGDAARVARAAGDLPRALKNALDARQDELATELTRALETQGADGCRAAADVLAHQRRFADAARLAEKAGDLDRAIDLYRAGHRELDAARLLEDAGHLERAGLVLEKFVRTADVPRERANAHLRLGRILAVRMRHDDAVRHLQEAAREADTAREARLLLVVELAAMGLGDAARDVLVEARAEDPSLPADVDEIVRRHRPTGPHREDARIVGGRYRLGELIGAGGAGRVYRGQDEVSGRPVAIKLLSIAYARGHAGFDRFVRESEIASALKHPNLVEVLDFSAEQGFLVMELLPGGSLARRLAPRLSEAATRRMLLDVLSGLEVAHRRGVIHRDVKPANIFFDARGTAKLGDFGVAHLLDLGQTQTGGLIGTLAYMSPEQITGAPLSIAADLYAVGVTLFESLTGRLPFQGPDFVAEHLGMAPPLPSEIDADLAPGWDPIVARLLAKSPTERFESVDAVRRALVQLQLGEGGHRPLILPKARASARRTAVPPIADAGPEPDEITATERYEFETALPGSGAALLSRALDTHLNRSVIIERWDGGMDPASESRLFALARCASPFVQRVLAYDRERGIVVYEAPAGTPLEASSAARGDAIVIARLLERLGLALAPLHRAGHAHGDAGAHAIVVDDLGYPTLMASGLSVARRDARPAGDIGDVLATFAGALHVAPGDLLSTLTAELSTADAGTVQAAWPGHSGDALYDAAAVLTAALLRARSRAPFPR